jgi:hypothetical protein
MRMMSRMMVAVLVLAAGHAFAEDEAVETEERPAARTFFLGMDAVGVLRGTLQLEAEHAVTRWLSVRLGLGGSLGSSDSDYLLGLGGGFSPFQLGPVVTDWKDEGWSVNAEPGLRFFLFGSAPEGLWVGPHLGLGLMRTRYESLSSEQLIFVTDTRMVMVAGDVMVGYTLLLTRGFTLQTAVGVRTSQRTSTRWARALNLDGELTQVSTPYESTQWTTQLAARISLGWTF